jgi:hypothetical protein
MDMKEASAMTEASGLTDNLDELETPSRTAHAGRNETRSSLPLVGVFEQLRRITVEAPLRSLFLAFILGVWVARRR